MITRFKIFENNFIIQQQPFLLRKSDYLYISDEFAKSILPTFDDKQGTDYRDFVYQENLDFLNNTKKEYKSSFDGNTITIKLMLLNLE